MALPSDLEEFDRNYCESQDEDFNPDAASDSESESDSGVELRAEQRTVRTRTQRADEPVAPKIVGEATVDVDALWREMNAPERLSASVAAASVTVPAASGLSKPSSAALPANASSPSTPGSTGAAGTHSSHSPPSSPQRPDPLAEKFVTIERTFKFAGKVTTEKKRVPVSSAEGQAYLREKSAEKDEASKFAPRKPGPVKRKSTLLEEYQAHKAKKINTLEKSKLDWFGFVDKEGISDELKRNNKSGYLDRMGFLARVENKIENDRREHNRLSRA